MSLHLRLFIVLSLFVGIGMTAAGYVTYASSRAQINSDYNNQMIADAYLVWTLVKEEIDEEAKGNFGEIKDLMTEVSKNELIAKQVAEYNRSRAFRVWKNGALLLRSDTAQGPKVPPTDMGFSERRVNGDVWNVYSTQLDDRNVSVEIWENVRLRHHLLIKIVHRYVLVVLIGLPLFWILLHFALKYALRRLSFISAEIEARSPDSLDLLDMPYIPREIRPLRDSINSLLSKVAAGLKRERELIDNAAHELRTPLAALRLQAQTVKYAQTDVERDQASRRLIDSIDRTSHVINQLLMLSGLGSREIIFSRVLLPTVIHNAVADRAPLAEEKQLEVTMIGPDAAVVQSHADLLQSLVGIFLDNAIKYCQTGGHIRIEWTSGSIAILDDGPGIPVDERDKIFQRFYRGKNTQGTGSGLGLAIAREIQELLDVKLSLGGGIDGRGLGIHLSFA